MALDYGKDLIMEVMINCSNIIEIFALGVYYWQLIFRDIIHNIYLCAGGVYRTKKNMDLLNLKLKVYTSGSHIIVSI